MAQVTIEQAMQIAIGHHRSGRLAEAEGLYRAVLTWFPDYHPALHFLGVLAGQVGDTNRAIALIGRAIALAPSVAGYHSNLGEIYRRAGQWERARAAYRQAITLQPDLAEAHNNLGIVLKAAGRLDEAMEAYRRALQLQPDLAEAHDNLGNALKAAGWLDEAMEAYRRALQLQPDLASAHNNLGNALKATGRLDEALAAYQRAIQLKPADAAAHLNYGVALYEMDRCDEAIAAYRQAIALQPDLAEAHNNLGIALSHQGWLDEAAAACRRAIALQPDLAEAHNNLGGLLRDQGCLDESLACFRTAVDVKPDFSGAASNLLSTLSFHPDWDAQAILAEHRRWARRYADPLATQIRPHQNDRAPGRRLRIGFLSPDLRVHPVGNSLLPLFFHHDRKQTAIVCYCDVPVADVVTEKLRALADEWHNTSGVGDPQVADRIRDDRIDILVDTSLHTANNRLLVFARKPAPLQMTMLGPPTTTGLATMDYRLTDVYLDPPGLSDGDYTERSIRLPHGFWCYQPSELAPPVSALPAGKNGHVTFGCLNQFAKITQPVLRLWVRILQCLPGSRLVLQSSPGSHLEHIRRLFLDHGISADRIAFVARALKPEYFRRYCDLDLCLDPFPCNGHTTTMDSLWMGVPVLTLAGRTAMGRGGVSILSNVGLPDLIAQTPEQYVEYAIAWASDLTRLAKLRAALRDRMRSSPLLDGKQYATDVETAWRRIWETWCGQY